MSTATPEAFLSGVLRDIVYRKDLEDFTKETKIAFRLRQLPEDERRRVVRLLPTLAQREPPASRARLWNALKTIVDETPLLAPDVTAEAVVRSWLRHAVTTEPLPEKMIAEFAQLPDDVARHLLDAFTPIVTDSTPERTWPFYEAILPRLRALHDVNITPADPGDADALAEKHLQRILTLVREGVFSFSNIKRLAGIDPLPEAARRRLLHRLLQASHVLERTPDANNPNLPYHLHYSLPNVIAQLAGNLTLSDDDETALLTWLGERTLLNPHGWELYPLLVDVLTRASRDGRLPTAALAVLRRTHITWSNATPELTPLVAALRRPELSPGEAWSDRALADLDTLDEEARAAWSALLLHAATAIGAKPSAKWERTATECLARVDTHLLRVWLPAWLSTVGKPRSTLLVRDAFAAYDPNLTFDAFNANVLRGLLWMLPLGAPADAARLLAHLVETSLRKVAGLGPRAPKIANAAVHALSRLDSEDALGQLTRLATQVTFKTTLKEIHKALDVMAARMNMTRDDLAELGVPSYGLTDVGSRRDTLGPCTVDVRAHDGTVRLEWRSDTGKLLKSPPASAKRDFAGELAALKSDMKDLEKMLGAQRDRLDGLMLQGRTWTFEAWRARYLDHPVVGVHARRLIWQVDGEAAVWHDGALRTLTGREVTGGQDVHLWHPLFATVEEVVAWRERLETLGVVQPFKQAHREVYLLTDAERATRVYSNRFAAHVLRQHQFGALCAARGWNNKLRLMVDDVYPPATKELPQYGLRAEFWIEGVGEHHGVDTNESGTYLRLTTDQVRFYRLGAPENYAHAGGGGYGQGWGRALPAEPVPLEDVPPLVLSEVLRDVDLFVGVASVGNDPTWQDGGPEGRFHDYWHSYSFGDLSATASTRREVLARLLPRLKIAARCHLTEKFLVVRGELRTYKIHLGSGNILMEPNDQYLCIVPARGAASEAGAFTLPFEGDATFSVILSKAFLLANDASITDPTITRQIKLH